MFQHPQLWQPGKAYNMKVIRADLHSWCVSQETFTVAALLLSPNAAARAFLGTAEWATYDDSFIMTST